MSIYSDYLRVIDKELALETNKMQKLNLIRLHDPLYFLNLASRVLEIAKNSTVLRCGNNIGHLTNERMAYESDGAHTNLAGSLVNYALDFIYGWEISPPTYIRRELSEAILIHDLPENDTGDTPDNGSRSEADKRKMENAFYDEFLKLYDSKETNGCHRVRALLTEMQEKTTEEGRILYLADKSAAIIMMLCYDYMGKYPYACPGEKEVSPINLEEMKLCDVDRLGGKLLSEIWTVDFFWARELTKYDDSGFFTALLIMATLKVRGTWYKWREGQYLP